MRLPEFVTKYHEWNSTKYLHLGSVKFGTLQEYRSSENADLLAARADALEGAHIRTYDANLPVASDVRFGGFHIENSRNIVIEKHRFQTNYNDWVFCCSLGPRSLMQHKKMVAGDPDTGYAGSPKLLGWTTFRAELLVDEIRRSAMLHSEFAAEPEMQWIFCGPVSYGKEHKHTTIRESNYREAELTENYYLKTVFTKEKIFEAELEFRILIRMKSPHFAPDGAAPIVLKSPGIERAIVEKG